MLAAVKSRTTTPKRRRTRTRIQRHKPGASPWQVLPAHTIGVPYQPRFVTASASLSSPFARSSLRSSEFVGIMLRTTLTRSAISSDDQAVSSPCLLRQDHHLGPCPGHPDGQAVRVRHLSLVCTVGRLNARAARRTRASTKAARKASTRRNGPRRTGSPAKRCGPTLPLAVKQLEAESNRTGSGSPQKAQGGRAKGQADGQRPRKPSVRPPPLSGPRRRPDVEGAQAGDGEKVAKVKPSYLFALQPLLFSIVRSPRV